MSRETVSAGHAGQTLVMGERQVYYVVLVEEGVQVLGLAELVLL